MAALAIPAVRQILARLAKGDKEEEEFVEKIENSCLKFDHDKKGMLTPDEYFNVMKLQNGVDCTKEEVISRSLIFILISTWGAHHLWPAAVQQKGRDQDPRLPLPRHSQVGCTITGCKNQTEGSSFIFGFCVNFSFLQWIVFPSDGQEQGRIHHKGDHFVWYCRIMKKYCDSTLLKIATFERDLRQRNGKRETALQFRPTLHCWL